MDYYTQTVKACLPAGGVGEGEGGAHGGPVHEGGEQDAAGPPQLHLLFILFHPPPAHQAAQVTCRDQERAHMTYSQEFFCLLHDGHCYFKK